MLSQDSFAFFVNPLNHVVSPIVPYNLLGSYPFSFQAPELYPTLLAWIAEWAGASPAVAECLAVLLASELGTAAVFITLRKLEEINYLEVRRGRVQAVLALALFQLNPFTISVTWWHISPWTFFYYLVPCILLVELDLVYSRTPSPRILAFAGLAILFLNVGTFGPYFLSVLFTFVIALVFLGVRAVRATPPVDRIASRVVGLLAVVATCAITNAAFAIEAAGVGVQPASLYISNSSPSDLVAAMAGSSINAGLANVFGGLGFLRLSPTFGNLYYAWYWFYPFLSIVALVIPLIFCGALLVRRHLTGLVFLWVVSLLAVGFAEGSNSPFGAVNESLLYLSPVFAPLTSGFYFFIEFYIVSTCVSAYFLMLPLESSTSDSTQNGHLQRSETSHTKPFFRNLRYDRVLKGKYTRTVVAASVAGLVLASSVPIIAGQLQMTDGQNSTMVRIPYSFTLLSDYLHRTYTGPLYNVLILPLSAIQGYDFRFNSSGYLDTSHLFARYIDYPVIDTDTGALSETIDSALSNGTVSGMLPLLQAAHVRYVVVNPYVDTNVWFMERSLKGKPLNYTAIESALNSTVGQATRVGQFLVYTVAGVEPLAYETTRYPVVAADSLGEYFSFLAGLNVSTDHSPFDSADMVWSNSTAGGTPPAVLGALSPGAPTQINPCAGCSLWLEYGNGTLVEVPGQAPPALAAFLNYSGGQVTGIHPQNLLPVANLSDLPTSLSEENGTLSNTGGQPGYLNLTELSSPLSPIEINLSARYLNSSNVNNLNLELVRSDLTLNVSIYQDLPRNDCDILMSARIAGRVYAINNTALKGGCLFTSVSLTIEIADSYVRARTLCSVNSSTVTTQDQLWIERNDDEQNGFHNVSIAPTQSDVQKGVFANLTVRGPTIAIEGLAINAEVPFLRFLTALPNLTSAISAQSTSVTRDAMTISVSGRGSSTSFVVLFESASSLWRATSDSTSDVLVIFNQVSMVWGPAAVSGASWHQTTTLEFRSVEGDSIVLLLGAGLVFLVILLLPGVTRVNALARRSNHRST